MRTHQADKIRYYTFGNMPNGRLTHAVFGRDGGVSPAPYHSLNMSVTVGDSLANVQENRRRALASVGLPPDGIADSWLVHSTRTLVVRENRDLNAPPEKADGLVTNVPGVALFMRYADCVPIMLYDEKKQAIGLGHSGWRGTVAGSTQSVVRTMVEAFGSNPHDIVAGVGPSICADHYEVGDEVVQSARMAFPDNPEVVVERDGRTYFDLRAANCIALTEAGVTNIELPGWCTASQTDRFFSHRAENGQAGRFGAVIALTQ